MEDQPTEPEKGESSPEKKFDIREKGTKTTENSGEKDILPSDAMIPESVPASPEMLKKFYEEEIVRKDRIIDELKKERDILIKTAMRQAERTAKIDRLISERSKKEPASGGHAAGEENHSPQNEKEKGGEKGNKGK